MIGNAMLGEYEQYSHAPSSKLVYNLHTLVFLGIVRRQGSCKTLRSKHHQTLSFNGTFPVKTFPCIRRTHYPGADVEVQLCRVSGGLSPPCTGFYSPRVWLGARGVCAHASSQLSKQ